MTKLSNLDIFGERKVSPVLSIIMLRHLHKQNHRNHPRRIEKNTGNLHFFSRSFSFIPSSASLEYIFKKIHPIECLSWEIWFGQKYNLS